MLTSVHDIDLLHYLFSDIMKLYCKNGPIMRKNSIKETSAINLTFESRMISTFIFLDAIASPHNWEGAHFIFFQVTHEYPINMFIAGENLMMPYTVCL